MSITSKTFCPLPWIHLATRPNGDVRVCCTANASGAGKVDNKTAGLVVQDGKPMNLRENSVDEIWNSEYMRGIRLKMLNEEIPNSCKKCFEEEANGIVSKRQWETREWKSKIDWQELVGKTQDDGSLPVNIPYFDLRLGNVCNLKCVMCSPHDSSTWIKDWKLQLPQYKNEELKKDQSWDTDFDYTWYKKSEFLDAVWSQIDNIQELYFAGGEPLMIPEHWQILKTLVAKGRASQVKLRYNTNGLKNIDKAVSYWNMFKEVKVNFSLDDLNERNHYIRHPADWNETFHSLAYFTEELDKRHQVNVACAVQALNVSNLPNLARWAEESGLNFNKRTHLAAPFINLHLVYLPSYLNVKVLPIDVKNFARRNIEEFLIEKRKDDYFVEHPLGQAKWEGLIKYMYSEDWSHKLPMMIEYLETCDKTRGLNFREVFPELGNLYND